MARGNLAGGEAQAVLEAQAMMAQDPELMADVERRIAVGSTAERAVYDAFAAYRALLAGAGEYLAGRVADLDDVRNRIVARLLGVGTVAVSPPTVPPATGPPLSATRVAMSPLPTPATLLRSTAPVGGLHRRATGCLSDHTETTQLPTGAVAVGVVCPVPDPSAALVSDATGSAAVPE